MAILFNIEKNVKINIKLIENYMLDIEINRNDFENYIPFDLCVETPLNKISLNREIPTFTLYELKNLITKTRKIIENKKDEDSYEYFSSEAFFNFKIEYLKEDDIVEIDFWINTSYIGDERLFGFDYGVKFCSNIEQVFIFL